MSVIVKGMKMPKNCLHCDFDDSYGICACRNEAPYVCEYSAKQRPSWCPLEELPSAQPVDKDTNVHCTDTQPKNKNEHLKTDQNAPNEDLISRKTAIDALKHNQDVYSHNFHDDPIDKYTTAIIATDIETIVNLPSAQPETHEERTETHACDLAEITLAGLPSAQPEHTNSCYTNYWCIDCKEYDTENKCCPRYSRVIKRTLDDAYRHGETEAEARFHAQQRWIPCSERLPEERQEILATTTDNAWGDVVIIRTYYKEIHKSVIAWMPLPEPYAERRTDEQDSE